MSGSVKVKPLNDLGIDGVLAGYKWASPVITWGFTSTTSHYSARYGHGELSDSFAPLSADQQAAVKAVMALYASYLQVELRFVGGTAAAQADIRIAQSGAPGTAWAYYPGANEGGDVWFNTDLKGYDKPLIGSYGWMTFLHEIGHAFGLKHGHESEGEFDELPGHQDTLEYTVMTYRSYEGAGTTSFKNGSADYPQTLMMGDIKALQSLYGADFSQAGRSLTYSWSPTTGETFINGISQGAVAGNRVFMTVWSGGGDVTYDLSAYGADVEIDLRPGEWSVFSKGQLARLDRNGLELAQGNVANAELVQQGGLNNLIRGAIGGAGDDILIGNAADNALTGGRGDDRLEGGGGRDTAVFSGRASDYRWAKTPDGDTVITDQRAEGDGVDTLVDIQWLRFSDQTLSISTPSSEGPGRPATSSPSPSAPGDSPAGSIDSDQTPAAPPAAPAPDFDLAQAYRNILQSAPDGTPLFAALEQGLKDQSLTPAMAIDRLIDAADPTTSVVNLTYQFFTGAVPGAEGMRWLLAADGPNGGNLNSAHYADQAMEHRFINFALALGVSGPSGQAFSEDFADLSPDEALIRAYTEIFGFAPAAAKVDLMLGGDVDPTEAVMTRWEYLSALGGGELGGKAAMVGWLLAEAIKADLGPYARANEAFLADLADGAAYGVDLIGVYGQAPIEIGQG